MKILVVYASTEGQTRKISQFASETLTDLGHSVELVNAEDADGIDPGRFDAAVLAGSVHVGQIQRALRRFAKTYGVALGMMPSLYLQVSLAAAGNDPGELADLDQIANHFALETGWMPDRTLQVAGAFRFTQYDFFKSWAMRWIAHQKGEEVDPHADKEYTDWPALKAALGDWVRSQA